MSLVDEILDLHEYMTDHVLRAGVGKLRWEKLISGIGKRSERRLQFICSFLKSLRENEWKAINETWNLPCATPEMWENMDLFFEHDTAFPEVKRLRDNYRKLKDKWLRFKEQYSEFIKEENEDKELHGLDD